MTILVFALIVFLAFVVETTVGFGSTVVTVSLAALFCPIDFILPVFVPVNLLVSIYLAGRYREHIARTLLVRRMLPIIGAGLVVGMVAFHGTDHRWLKPVFGAFVVAISVFELVSSRARGGAVGRPLTALTGAGWLFAGGVVHGIFATGGPLVVYFLGRELHDKAAFRATLAVLWLVLNLALIVSYGMSEKLTSTTVQYSLVMMLPLFAGTAVGEWLHHRLDAARFRLAVFLLLGLAGTTLLVSSLR